MKTVSGSVIGKSLDQDKAATVQSYTGRSFSLCEAGVWRGVYVHERYTLGVLVVDSVVIRLGL